MRLKTFLIASGLFVGGLVAIGYHKAKSLKAIFDKMTIEPTGIRNLNFGLVYFTFDLDFTIKNPTQETFSVSGASVATLKRILVYRKTHFLGMAEINLDAIEIPANGELTIKNIPFSIATENVIKNILTKESLDVDELTIMAVIDVLGNEYIIES